MTYKIAISSMSQTVTIVRDEVLHIPCDLENTDCAKFLQDWKDGAEVLDADGNPLPYSDEALAALEVKP